MGNHKRTNLKEANPWTAFVGDLVGRWLDARCYCAASAAGYRTPAASLFRDFEAWCAGEQIATACITTAAFGRALSARGILRTKGSDGRVLRWPVRLAAGESC